MDYSIHIDIISMEKFFLYFQRLLVKFSIKLYILSMKIVFILANGVDSYEMQLPQGFTGRNILRPIGINH